MGRFEFDEDEAFREFIDAAANGQAVYVHGDAPRRLTVYVFPHTRQETSAQRLHDALWALLPPNIYHELKDIMNGTRSEQ